MFKGKYQFSGVLVFGRVGILPIFIGFTHKMTFCTYLTHEFTYQFHPFYPICIEDVSPTFQSPVSRDCEALAYPYEANDCREAEKFPANLNGRIYSWGVGDLYMWMFPKIVVPQIIHFNRDFNIEPSLLGYPYFWKYPCIYYKQAFWMVI